LEQLSAGQVSAFVLRVGCEQRLGKAKTTVTALRSLLGFLHLEGLVSSSLAAAVPSVASWRLAGLPRGLQPDEVSRLLAACDRRTVPGRRDLAMLLLLVRLGLRAGEVAGLGLDDIDWRAGQVTVCGKGDGHTRLPLPDDVGQAIVGYLRDGRPATAQGRWLFVRLAAPHRRLTAGAVSAAVFAAGQRAGLGTVRAHRLRHTAATRMLAAGAGLTEIGQVLGHRKASTTAIYAKVDRDALRVLARPWPRSTR
jgi:integrase